MAPMAIAIADFDGDGENDLAVANKQSDNVSILIGNGDGFFWPAVNYNVGDAPESITAGHFNADTKPDLAVGNSASNNVSVLINNGDGTFAAAVPYASTSTSAIVAADFSGDSKPLAERGRGEEGAFRGVARESGVTRALT